MGVFYRFFLLLWRFAVKLVFVRLYLNATHTLYIHVQEKGKEGEGKTDSD